MASTKDMPMSSPDPLSMSNSNISSHSPTKTGRQPLITPRKALGEVSGNTQVQEFYIDTPPNPPRNASPKKSPRQRNQSTSPWRILLTVQAEPVADRRRPEKSPMRRLTERTTTTTVPLKGGDETPPAVEKKGRGRPRKSLDGPLKRSGTPKPKIRRRTIPESPKKQDVDAHSEIATPPKKLRGRPKKSMEAKDMEPSMGSPPKKDLDPWLESSGAGGGETAEMRPKTVRTRSRRRRQEITPVKIAVNSDNESRSSLVGATEENPKETAWTIGNRNAKSDQMDQKLHESDEALKPEMERSLSSRLSDGQSDFGRNDWNGMGSVTHRDTRSPNPHTDNAQVPIEFDPTAQHQEYDTILESEGFSMVSVSSLPSMRSSSVSSPQQYGILHEHTPTIISSPSVPPAPEVAKIPSSTRQLEIASDGTPKLTKVVRAGIALQGVLNPRDRSQKLGSPFRESQKSPPFLTTEPKSQRSLSHDLAESKSPEERSDDLFRGFSAATRRELKAGLRLGEELAKRQQRTSQRPMVGPEQSDDVFHQTSSPKYPQLPASDSKEGHSLEPLVSEKPVRYPLLSNDQLPSPERSLVDEEEDRMSWKAGTPIKQEGPAFTSAQVLVSDDSVGPNTAAIDRTMMARQEEWQREREAVSRQIEMANKSQVIIINSDNEEEEEEGRQGSEDDVAASDIWQSEAQSADHFVKSTPEASSMSLQPEVLKPRRSKLPSPWRRNSQIIYSDEVEPTESDLFWQPDQLQARASKRRDARKTRIQSQSDVSAESLVGSSLENPRKADAQNQLEASEAWSVDGSLLDEGQVRETAPSAEHTLHDGSMQHADKATSFPVVVTPSENRTMLESPTTPKEVSLKDVKDVSEKIAILEVTESLSAERTTRTSKDNKAVIDPRLFREKPPSSVSNNPIRPIRPIQPWKPMPSSTSWLSRLTGPIWSVLAPAAPLPPPATKEDILCSSPHEPLCQLTPWEECHFRALGPLYYGSLLYGAHLFPFNARSPSARYCGAYVTTKLGWSRKITPEDCGITDAFMVLLDERGYALGEQGARWIDEGMVITMCVALWVGMVKRGEIEVDRSKGERIGSRDQGDRKWTKDDIDWASNQSEYFERKRREFDGLPSWKTKT